MLSNVPYKYRLGNSYSKSIELIHFYENSSDSQRYKYLIEKLNNIVRHAQNKIPFYRHLYGQKPITIKKISDFEKLPVITKSLVRDYTKNGKGAYLLNTGGSSGEPLSFYVDKNAWAREWAHMHYIWNMAGYKPTDLMVTLLGKNIGNNPYKYNPVHNEFRLNPYIDNNGIITELKTLFKNYPIKYFQGYPSSIYNFYKELEPLLNDVEKREITQNIKCCFLSSEYPQPYMIDYLKINWGLEFISWYGHSEMCILAYDTNLQGQYKPLITYGFAEEVNETLIGTSFNNYDMPLIRYSTDDIIESSKDEFGILNTFKITSGRTGDFITDINGKKIPLTSFIFGRHHKIFDIADFIQIKQSEKGKATFFLTFKEERKIPNNGYVNYFDLSNIKIDFDFKIVQEPILTQAGKLKLKI